MNTGARWTRITQLMLSVDRDHEWYALHDDLVTRHVRDAHCLGIQWHVPDKGMGILEVLELEAKRHGLIGDEPAPPVDSSTLAERLLAMVEKAA
jgi:hypothetical protein